jgi:hypothetical protein
MYWPVFRKPRVHPCVCRISPLAHFISVFAGYPHWHSSSLCVQDIISDTVQPVFAGYHQWHSSSPCLQDIPIGTVHPCVFRISPLAQFIHVLAGYPHWHSSSLCVQDIINDTVHPCVCRISPLVQFIPVFAGYQWHSLSLCLQDIPIGTVHPCVYRISPLQQFIHVFAGYPHWHLHWVRWCQSTPWCTCLLYKPNAAPRTVVSARALLDVTVPAPTCSDTVAIAATEFMICIRNVVGSNLDRDTNCVKIFFGS